MAAFDPLQTFDLKPIIPHDFPIIRNPAGSDRRKRIVPFGCDRGIPLLGVYHPCPPSGPDQSRTTLVLRDVTTPLSDPPRDGWAALTSALEAGSKVSLARDAKCPLSTQNRH